MQECKWSYFKFGYYFQYTKSNVFQIIGQEEGQWRTKPRKQNKIQKILIIVETLLLTIVILSIILN
jgi:hypothetical protein